MFHTYHIKMLFYFYTVCKTQRYICLLGHCWKRLYVHNVLFPRSYNRLGTVYCLQTVFNVIFKPLFHQLISIGNDFWLQLDFYGRFLMFFYQSKISYCAMLLLKMSVRISVICTGVFSNSNEEIEIDIELSKKKTA